MAYRNWILGSVIALLSVVAVILFHDVRLDRAFIEKQKVLIQQSEANAISVARMLKEVPVTSAASSSDSTEPPEFSVETGSPSSNLPESAAFVSAMTANNKSQAREQVFDLPQWIDVSEDTLDQLAGVMAKYEMESMQGKIGFEDLPIRKDAEISQILGHPRFLRWQAYERAATSRRYIRDMGANLPLGKHLEWEKVPLASMAMSQAEEATRSEAALKEIPAGQEPAMEVDTAQRVADAILASAEPYLSGEQHAMLSEIVQRDVDTLRASYAMQDARPDYQAQGK